MRDGRVVRTKGRNALPADQARTRHWGALNVRVEAQQGAPGIPRIQGRADWRRQLDIPDKTKHPA